MGEIRAPNMTTRKRLNLPCQNAKGIFEDDPELISHLWCFGMLDDDGNFRQSVGICKRYHNGDDGGEYCGLFAGRERIRIS